jgi:HPt (histidine-containing phosphotransfer) domain-containing protein
LENLLGAITRVVEARQAGASAPSGGAEAATHRPALPVLDQLTFERTAALLNGSSMRGFLDTLTARALELRKTLSARDNFPETAGILAEAAHKLAGSAGMFGFDRLAHVAKDFEHAIKAQSPETAALADDLDLVLDASLSALRSVTLPTLQAVLH